MGGNEIALLHGFIKKSQKTPKQDLVTAQERQALWLRNQDLL